MPRKPTTPRKPRAKAVPKPKAAPKKKAPAKPKAATRKAAPAKRKTVDPLVRSTNTNRFNIIIGGQDMSPARAPIGAPVSISTFAPAPIQQPLYSNPQPWGPARPPVSAPAAAPTIGRVARFHSSLPAQAEGEQAPVYLTPGGGLSSVDNPVSLDENLSLDSNTIKRSQFMFAPIRPSPSLIPVPATPDAAPEEAVSPPQSVINEQPFEQWEPGSAFRTYEPPSAEARAADEGVNEEVPATTKKRGGGGRKKESAAVLNVKKEAAFARAGVAQFEYSKNKTPENKKNAARLQANANRLKKEFETRQAAEAASAEAQKTLETATSNAASRRRPSFRQPPTGDARESWENVFPGVAFPGGAFTQR